ncbi:hypothetical protein O6H91_07G087400 [Diphasiastrum complanatum]|uniref:Uncharacterized protein n=2 Tax=Diphasiastrum complanatum TaxID=34168 RepID=A0ACC2D8E4_DIPCM|nr:hypothetical protein O6H91_07G087400 [Diphasiastrum complanatum]KAJ7550188.1 hypothetical protein O6H91_07G087400 [Diphasiastrum complanatum]
MSEQNNSPQSSPPACQSGPCISRSSTVKIYQTIIFALPILFTLILIVLFCLLYMRRRRTVQASSQVRTQFFVRSRLPAPADSGLGKIFRDSLPVTIYDDKFAATNEDCQCPVCLNDFEPNDKLRVLPVCSHCFHLDCIDEWIINNSTCPVCRSTLVVSRRVVPLKVPVHEAVGVAESVESNEARQSRTIEFSERHTPLPEVVNGAANV